MKKLEHVRDKAVHFRKNGFSLPDICERLNQPKTTVYYWIKNVVMEKPNAFLERTKSKSKKAAQAVRKKFRKIHREARKQAVVEWVVLKKEPGFCLFLMMYLCEGHRKTRHRVSVANSDDTLMRLSVYWMRRINYRKKLLHCTVQIHIDQDEDKIINFWNLVLHPDTIKISRKSNSGKLSGRNWCSKNGVATIMIRDAYLKTKLDFWMDQLKKEFM